jgi:hypothetical protein
MSNCVLLQSDSKPLPYGYRWFVENKLVNLRPWYFITEQSTSDAFRREFIKETSDPNPSKVKDLQPFAMVGGNDDVAGFAIHAGRVSNEVVVVHLTWSGRSEFEGFPGMTRYADIWEWFADCVIGEMKHVAENEEAYYQRQGGR